MKNLKINSAKILMICLLQILCVEFSLAQNPISPPGYYLADPSARSWDDSTLYLYTSTDESCEYWCSWEHDVLYTTDMKNWNIASDVFSSKGDSDNVSYNEKLLFAPDVAKMNDTYVMYYCQPDENNALGTAISKTPTGPFKDGQILNTTEKYSQIDPAVFTYDDGTSYIVWGQGSMKMAVLYEDMRTIDSTTIRDGVLTYKDHYFHEGPYMTKRNGVYYMVFADESRNHTPSSIGYATSEKPFGPYTYRGVIIDNEGSNPGNWNNHGSIIKFKDQWYVFYHRSTHGCDKFRKSCVEKIEFLPDGTIPEVEMTTQGALPPLDARQRIDAERACLMKGNVRIEKESAHNEKLSQIKNGDQATYKYLNFGNGVSSICVRYSTLKNSKLILYVGRDQEKKKIGEIDLKPSQDSNWKKETFDIQMIKGVEALTFELVGEKDNFTQMDWFEFYE